MSSREFIGVGLGGWLTTITAGLVLLVVGVGGTGGELLAAIVGSIALVVFRFRLGQLYAFAIGQVTLVAALGNRSPLGLVILTEGILLAMLLAPEVGTTLRRQRILPTLGFVAVLTVVGLGGVQTWGSYWVGGLSMTGIGGLMAYVLHRYEQVQLGVVSGE